MSRFAALFGAAIACTTMACAPAVEDESDSAESATSTNASAPADPRATAATRTVLANLHTFDFGSADPFDHRILVGQQESDVSNRSASGLAPVVSDISLVTGKEPALVSYELSHLDGYDAALTMFDPAAFRAGRGALRERVLDKHRKGTLVSFVWHMRCPKSAPNQPDKFGPADCPSDYRMEELLERKPNGERGAHFTEWRAMLDELAELLFSLKDEHGALIPVQIRPFHELTGGWFWWGKQNAPDSYAAAWREMVTYLRDGRGAHNALWVFCPAAPTTAGFEDFYPGDAYADVIAFDRYDFGDGTFARGFEADLRNIGAFARTHRKVAAVAEVGRDLGRLGVSSDPTWFTRTLMAPLEAQGRSFGYVGLWRNAPWEKFIPEPGDGSIADDLRRMSTSARTVFAGRHDLYRPLHVAPGAS